MRIKFACGLLIVFLLLGKGGFMQGISEAAGDTCNYVMNAIKFSNDPDKLLFRYRCKGLNNPNYWAIYEFSSTRAYNFDVLNKSTKNAINDSPAFSRDGKLITFVAGQDNHRNIFVMNADGSNVRQLTHDYNENPKEVGKDIFTIRLNESPSFSPDGKRIIFKRSAVKRLKAKNIYDPMLPSRWDIYEIEIETARERRLTNYEFYLISQPFYHPDGKRFIFSANLLINASSMESGIDRKARDRYWDKYKENTIFIMDGKSNTLQPVLKNGPHSDEPRMAYDGVILFRSKINEHDKLPPRGPSYYDLFVYKENEVTRLMNSRFEIFDIDISPCGEKAAFLYDDSEISLIVVNLDGKAKKDIIIPWHQILKWSYQGDRKR
jgi:Tol biopolymer transport system component